MDGATLTRTEEGCPKLGGVGGLDASAVSLVVRGDRLPLRNAVASCYNSRLQHLVVVTPPALFLFGQLLELGGELLGVATADENVQFQLATPLPWLDAYGVLHTTLDGRIEHRVLSADFKSNQLTHVVAERVTLLACICNPGRREVITADSDGGFKVWVLRAAGATQTDSCSFVKGFQRVHAGSRKMQYRHLYLSKGERTIIACTTSRIHAFDSTTCARIATLYNDPSHTINKVAFHRELGNIYLQTCGSMREIHKFDGTSSRGRIDGLLAAGSCFANENVVAFAPVEREDSTVVEEEPLLLDAILVLDSCGRLFVGPCADYEPASVEGRQGISLPLIPSQTFTDIHSELRRDVPRNFILVVSTSGLVVIEAILPGTSIPNRRVITNVAGLRLDLLQSEECQRVAIVNSNPPSLLCLDGNSPTVDHALLLHQSANHHPEAEETGLLSPAAVVGLCALSAGIVVAWSNGKVSLFSEDSARVSTVCRVGGSPSTISAVQQRNWVIVGTGEGSSSLWAIHPDGVSIQMSSKDLHNKRVINVVAHEDIDNAITVLSMSCDGEVKFWQICVVEGWSVMWELIVYFRTYASTISATALMDHEYLFCGSDAGGLECWRLPCVPSFSERANHSQRRNVAILRQPLHSVDLHLTRICQICVEPGGAERRMSTAPPHLNEFAWVVTYDLDRIVLVWCFSTKFFFPHRKLLLHSGPTGGYLALGEDSCCHFYAYLGRCLDRVDLMGEIDIRAVQRRLFKAREIRDGTQTASPHVHIERSQNHNPPTFNELESHRLTALSLKITLPTVEQADALNELEAIRQKSPANAFRHKIKRPPVSAQSILTEQPQAPVYEHIDERPPSKRVEASTTLFENELPLALLEKRRATRSFQPSQRHRLSPSTTSFGTLPGDFLKAKPRLYHAESRPKTSTSQARCAVVASISAPSHQKRSLAAMQMLHSVSSQKQGYQRQDHVAIVTATDGTLSEGLRLDFSGSRKEQEARTHDTSFMKPAGGDFQLPRFLEWSSLSVHDQVTELQAACRSRFVLDVAKSDQINIPTPFDFGSDDVKSRLKVRAFTRWYLASDQYSRRPVRDAFLREELRFAVRDSSVIVAMKSTGCAVPRQDTFEDETSREWLTFMGWYATGESDSAIGNSALLDAVSRLAQRRTDRTAFLKRRIEVLNQSTDISVFIFDASPRSSGFTHPKAAFVWEELTLISRCKEIALALQNPMVEIAAIADGVELPHQFIAGLENGEILVLASPFVAWWISDENALRQELLNQTLKMAGCDAPKEDGITLPEANGDEQVLTDGQPSSPRTCALVNSLRLKQKRNRIESISRGGSFPVPVVFETWPPLLFLPFEIPPAASPLPTVRSVAERIQDELTPFHESDEIGVTGTKGQEEPVNTIGTEDEASRREQELTNMAVEDELSREMRNGYESGSDDDHDGDSVPIEPPKRTDFTKSYFFGNLPKTFRINAGGWIAGSGLDNGDEEIEEEERLERERQRQEMLDRLEAERIAEAERQAERLRLEREMDEKAMQLRRLRQVELRKVLLTQAELEMRRAEQDEHEITLRERLEVAEEERLTRLWLTALGADRTAMVAEDKLAEEIAAAERSAKRSEMRRVISELTQMDAEDRRSAMVQAQQLRLEVKRLRRVQYLKALYEPFEPFFPASREASEDTLPVIRQRPKKATKLGSYAVPFSEAVVMDEINQEHHYAARDSRKLRQLMGLPLHTPPSHYTLRIPTVGEIIKTRHDLQLQLPHAVDPDEEARSDLEPKRINPSSHRQLNHSRLPQLVPRKTQRDDHLSDMSAMMADSPSNQHRAHISKKSNSRSSGSPEQQQRILPFFRGNFMVEGMSRSHAYAHK